MLTDAKSNTIIISFVVIIFALVAYIWLSAEYRRHKAKETNFIQVDTTYNKIVLDCIEKKITVKDSVIYNIKTEMKDEKVKVLNMSDSAAVALFYELLSEYK